MRISARELGMPIAELRYIRSTPASAPGDETHAAADRGNRRRPGPAERGATLISLLEAPATVSDLWERFRQHTQRTGRHARVAFDWFALALSMLFTLQVVRWNDNQELERCHAPA